MGVSVVPSFSHPVRLETSPEISGRFSAAMGGTSSRSPSKRTLISSRSSSILSAKSTNTGITFLAVTGCCARLASKSWALLMTSPAFPTYASSFWLKARDKLSLSTPFRCTSISSFRSSLAFLFFSCRKETLASNSSIRF